MSAEFAQAVYLPVGMATAGTAKDTYANHGLPGEWQLVSAYLVASADVTADASHYATMALIAGGTTIASFTTATVGCTEGTPRAFALTTSPKDLIFSQADAVEIDKAVTGNGVAIEGNVVLGWRRVPADTMYT